MKQNTAGVAVDGGRLRDRRKELRMNLVTFAPLAGISVQYLSQIERGTRPTVSPMTFGQLCDAAQVEDPRTLMAPTERPRIEADAELAGARS